MKRLTALALLLAAPASADTVLAARTVRTQAILTPADVTVIEDDTLGSYASLDEVVGLEARNVLYAGRPIRIEDLGPPALVDRNQIVTLYFRTAALTLAAEGRALGRAGIGDRVRVMNLASRQIVTGTVRPDGAVDMSPVRIHTTPLSFQE